MRDPIQSWRALGVEVVIVGNGNRDFAEDFREAFEIEGLLLVDPNLHAYRAAGLRRGHREIASPKLIGNTFRALREGARPGAVLGDPWQLGGVFVLAPGGDLLFQYRSEAAGDHADPADIDAALDEMAEVIEEDAEDPSLLGSAMNAIRPALDVSPLLSFDRLGFQRHQSGFAPNDLDVDLYGRRCVLTEATSGIGYEAALALADLGAEVCLLSADALHGDEAARSIREATGNNRAVAFQLDLADADSIDEAVRRIGQDPVDVLVHCADVLPTARIETMQGFELAFAMHVAGPHRLTRGLTPGLEASDDARVVWVSSDAMLTRRLNVLDPGWTDRDYDGLSAYLESKRAAVILSELWAETFSGTSVQVNAMHPGWVETSPLKKVMPLLYDVAKPILRKANEGADTIVWLAASHAAEGHCGEFFFDREAVRTHWLQATRESSEERDTLWHLCDDD